MPAKNITNLRIENGELLVTFSTSNFYQYSGYMLEGAEGNLNLSMIENFELFSINNPEEVLKISLDQHSEYLENIKEITINVVEEQRK